MPDISMCKGTSCPIKDSCYRHVAKPNRYLQTYFTTPPIKDRKQCDYYWKIDIVEEEEVYDASSIRYRG